VADEIFERPAAMKPADPIGIKRSNTGDNRRMTISKSDGIRDELLRC
jgi:hypothetical protein